MSPRLVSKNAACFPEKSSCVALDKRINLSEVWVSHPLKGMAVSV